MYHTISEINKPIKLQDIINNKCGKKKIGLKSLTYTIGWYNVIDENIKIKTSDGAQRKYDFEDGYYSLQNIINELKNLDITLTVNMQNGFATVESENEINISPGLSKMLGIDNKKWIRGDVHTGEKSVDFAPYKQLYIYLDQINTTFNYFNGVPSRILGIVPVENRNFGDIVHKEFIKPLYKQLSGGDISELSVSVCDEKGDKINNHEFPISCELEIIS